MVKNLPASAGDAGLIPGPGRSQVPRRNSPSATVLKPACLAPVLHNKRRHCSEKPTHCNWRKPVHSSKDPAQPKINK